MLKHHICLYVNFIIVKQPLAAFNRFVSELEREELMEELQKLYARFEPVRQYYHIELSGDASYYLNRAKQQIRGMFYTKEGRPKRPKASKLNDAVREFEKLSIYSADLVELLAFRVTESLKFINQEYYFQNALINSTVRAYDKLCSLAAGEPDGIALCRRLVAQAEYPLETAFEGVFYDRFGRAE
jgi:hypothetical protein